MNQLDKFMYKNSDSGSNATSMIIHSKIQHSFIISTPTFTVNVSGDFSEFESHIQLTKRVLREAREAIAEFERLTATL